MLVFFVLSKSRVKTMKLIMARIILVVTELLEGEKMLIIRVENNEVVSIKQAMSCDKELSDYIKLLLEHRFKSEKEITNRIVSIEKNNVNQKEYIIKKEKSSIEFHSILRKSDFMIELEVDGTNIQSSNYKNIDKENFELLITDIIDMIIIDEYIKSSPKMIKLKEKEQISFIKDKRKEILKLIYEDNEVKL